MTIREINRREFLSTYKDKICINFVKNGEIYNLTLLFNCENSYVYILH